MRSVNALIIGGFGILCVACGGGNAGGDTGGILFPDASNGRDASGTFDAMQDPDAAQEPRDGEEWTWEIPAPPDQGGYQDPGAGYDPGPGYDYGPGFDPGPGRDTGVTLDALPYDYAYDGPVGGCDGCQYGWIEGIACAPNRKTGIAYVRVWVNTVDCDGKPVTIQTYTNAQGEYRLKVPCGSHVVFMEKGSFKTSFTRYVEAGKVTGGTTTDGCFPADAAKIAVITGDWDVIEYYLKNILRVRVIKEYPGHSSDSNYIDSQTLKVLTNYDEISKYDILFINCSDSASYIMSSHGAAVSNNLRKFVENGGSLYMSDYAFLYFEMTWPEFVNFPGNPYVMDGNQNVTGRIVDQDMAKYLGKDQVDLRLGLGPLVSATGIGQGTTLHIDGYIKKFGEYQPLLMSFRPYVDGGQVIYTIFHNEEQGHIAQDLGSILDFVVFLL
jgi:hypothetical protein